MTVRILHGDALEMLRTLADESVHSIVTDPPYGLEFMGKEWDGADGFRRSLNKADVDRESVFGRTSRTSPEYRATNDFQRFCEAWARECLRVLKPGGHLLSFGGSRTYHRMACAIEDAGFEIRDQIMWLYGSGFPKSLDVSKAIDRKRDDLTDVQRVAAFLRDAHRRNPRPRAEIDAFFETKNIGGHWFTPDSPLANCPTWEQWLWLREWLNFGGEMDAEVWRLNGRKGMPGEAWDQRPITQAATAESRPGDVITFDQRSSTERERRDIPATDAARQWQGWGTALKPAHEPIVVARKPLIGTVAANVLAHGTGAINVDACRVEGRAQAFGNGTARSGGIMGASTERGAWESGAVGRWPANLIHDGSDEVLAGFPEADSARANGNPNNPKHGTNHTASSYFLGDGKETHDYRDSGSAARFFKECKWESESSDPPASNAGNQSGSCETPTAAEPAEQPIRQGQESLHFQDSTSESRSYTQTLSHAPAEQWDSTDTTPTTATPWVLNGFAQPAIDASINLASEERAAAGIDQGQATRFWYSAKASREDRNIGCEELPEIVRANGNKWTDQAYRVSSGERTPGRESGPRRNHHPTVKPTDLMQYLVRLVTPPGGTVLDPFAGSGSTGLAADREGFNAILIERDGEYIEIARRRIRGDCPLFDALEIAA